MFSGIVENIGVIERIKKDGNLSTIRIRPKSKLSGLKKGDSVSISGVCLTLTELKGTSLTFDVMKETFDKTTLGNMKLKDFVNLERALKVSDRINGHFVTGHVDGVGKVSRIVKDKNYIEFHVKAPRSVLSYIVTKGSVSIDGVSLTVGKVGKSHFSFYLIPYTDDMTTLGRKKEGDSVNIETDILAKYILNKDYV